MGLETVELVLEIEEHFGISISDEEAEKLRTVSDITDLIHGRVDQTRSSWPGMREDWRKMKDRVARIQAGTDQMEPSPIRPRDLVVAKLAPAERRRLWADIHTQDAEKPAPLDRPARVASVCGYLMLTAVIGLMVTGFWRYGVLGLAAGILTSAVVSFVIDYATRGLRSEPPPGWETFGNLTRRIVGREAVFDSLRYNDHDQVMTRVREFVSDQMGVRLDEIKPETRFIEDLGMD